MREILSAFPPPDDASDPDGLLAYSDDLSTPLLLDAYAHAIFPWPCEEESVLWFSPPARGILDFSRLHISKRLKRFLKNSPFTLDVDRNFSAVLRACASARRAEEGTWITGKMIAAYEQFHALGYAHSFEAYDETGQLAGGLYGVGIDRFFGGESMFFHKTGASKFALLGAVATLKNLGLEWIDTQMVTPITASFGAESIDRSEFLARFEKVVRQIRPIDTELLRASLGRPEELL